MNMSREDAIKWCIKKNCDFNAPLYPSPIGWGWCVDNGELILINNTLIPEEIRLKNVQEYIRNDETNTTLWDERILGHDEAHVKVASVELSKAVNESLGFTEVTFRTKTSIINKLNEIASKEGIGRSALISRIVEEYINK